MHIKNLFTTVCIFLFAVSFSIAQTAGIPQSEYKSLKELYDNSQGALWTNNTNWLDTTNYLADDWFGITVEDGHVIKIEVPANNLQEGIFSTRVNLPELRVLDLSSNNIENANFNNLDSLSKLHTLKIENNRFLFKHIQPVFYLPQYERLAAGFTYSPQAKIDIPEEISFNRGEWIEMSVNSNYVSPGDEFQWYKDGVVQNGETYFSYDKENATYEDAGTYYLKIINSNVPGLILQSYDKELTVNDLVGNVPRSEYNALIALYNATDGENWNDNTNWLDTINHVVDDWFGITVENNHVTEINLSYNKLKGEIPPEIGDLSRLTSLLLNNNNDITGPIPSEIGNLNNLVNLNLSGNYLNGSICPEIGNLSKLTTLNLRFNGISGVLPSEIGSLSELKYFFINHNKIEGPIPFEMSNLKKLEIFHINANRLGKIKDGDTKREPRQIPEDLQELSSLLSFKIGQNYLLFNDIEPIFSWSNFDNIIEFKYELQTGLHKDIEINIDPGETFKLTIPNYVPAPSDRYVWKKDNNVISGANDSVLFLTDVQLEDEGFYNCIISNEIATGVNIHINSTTIRVNDIHGAGVPLTEYKALVDFYNSNDGENWRKKSNWLDTIKCTVNEWEGIWVIDGHVKEISMDTNNVSGSFPRALYKLKNLERLRFFMNNLSGSLPDDIDSLSNLQVLYLSDNKFEGQIPTSLGNLNNLNRFNINNNQLTGSIPESMGGMDNLFSFEVGNNNLSGKIPSSLGNLVQLRILDLSHNQLVGPLPLELENLVNLFYFDLDNNLIGKIDFNKSSALIKSISSQDNRQIPDELADLMQMDTLYLGGNKLQFNDIEAIFSWENYSEFEDFIYAPQDSVGLSKTIEGKKGGEITVQIDHYFPGPSDQYQWYKNGEVIEGANSSSLFYENLEEADSGIFICKITNPVANELTLYSKAIKLIVSDAVGTEDVAQVEVNLYPNPAAGQLYLDVQNRHVNLEIFNATGSLVRTLPDITNGWIEVSELRKGIYLFKIKLKDSQTLFKKVIIRN
jgi:Leucine-rich repeat (LRR) protein